MDDNFNPQNFGGMNNQSQGMPGQGQGRPMPPPPPPPEITLRTMQSDIESVKQSGGESPIPKPFTPPELEKQPTMELNSLSKDEEMIKPANGEGVLPPSEPKKSGTKAVVLITALVLVLAAAVYVGYAYVYPMFSKPAVLNTNPINTQATSEVTTPVVETTPVSETETLATTTTPSESLSTTAEEAELSELATTTGMASTTEELATTTETVAVIPVKLPHVSYLVSQPEMTAQITLTSTSTLASIKDLLIAEAGNKPTTTVAVKEIIFSNELGQPAFADVLSMLLPEFTAEELKPLFKGDFTAVMTYDKDGTWIGLVAGLNDGVASTTAQTTMAKLEQSASLANLYIQNPGKPAASFKAGTANNIPVRYLPFANVGASLNYGWTNNNLFVMSSSYNGMKALLTKLGVQ